ncbi:MAG TPA: riboflavin biosynthesis protein RibF [Tepidisphaeraceae bacterium]|jgi:riboflavin kinase/FMN adenylyltransferase|nr:riboflavin biosynthesis protein RibF [Tepidisphaeraceae bacterium]
MTILPGLDGLRQLAPGSILSIGNFDGVHRGHQSLLALARDMRAKRPGARLALATFEPHPLTVLRPQRVPPRLTPRDFKRELLAQQGVDDLVELAPEPAVLNLTAEDFWRILRDEVRPFAMIEGSEFNFGKGRGGNIHRLREWAAASDVKLHVAEELEVPLLDMRVVPVSSTVVRWLIAYGRVRDAAICLGRPYALRGEVIKGHQRGREIGVPTANLQCDQQLVPDDAVYAGRTTIDGTTYPAAVSIGTMPTFGENQRQVEAHLVGFSGDLYGREITVQLLDWLREQRKYASVELMMQQIAKDVADIVQRYRA